MTDDKLLEFQVQDSGERLDKLILAQLEVLEEYETLSRTQIQGLIKDGQVTVNDSPAKPGIKLRGGERVRVRLPAPLTDEYVQPEEIPLQILYNDDVLAVVNKPAGMVVHPGDGNETGTLVNALLARYPQIAAMPYDPRRRGIVHRLDKDTSGLLVVAKTAEIQRALMAQFSARSTDKTYLALLEQTPETSTGRIDAPIGRDPEQRKRMAVLRRGKPASTDYRVLEQFRDGQVLVEVKILTGRTHQIRVHMAFIGCPVVGDKVYGYRKQRLGLKRHFLHAARLCFDHPITQERLCLEAPLPQELQQILDHLRQL